jgi:hypothetical protein
VVQRCDVLVIFGPAQRPFICEDIGELGEWQFLDDLGAVNQVIGVPAI